MRTRDATRSPSGFNWFATAIIDLASHEEGQIHDREQCGAAVVEARANVGYNLQTWVMETTTLAVKVSEKFARRYREFCDAHALQVGKFTEQALTELMEDYHFGAKAQRVLSATSGRIVSHEQAFKKQTRSR